MSLLLPLIVGLPLAGAIAAAVIPRNYRFVIRAVAQAMTFASMLLAFVMFAKFIPGAAGYQFVANYEWVKSLGINLKLGVDGLNVGLVLMGAIVAFAATLGAFASLDIFFLYFFHELALIPTFIMIGVWGKGDQKNYATFNITLYLTLGALIALIGLIALYVQSGANSFDIEAITAHVKAFASATFSIAASSPSASANSISSSVIPASRTWA